MAIDLEKKIWQFRKILTLKSFARLKVESFHLTAKDQVVFLSCSINVIMIKLDDLKFEKAQRPALQGREKNCSTHNLLILYKLPNFFLLMMLSNWEDYISFELTNIFHYKNALSETLLHSNFLLSANPRLKIGH